MQTEAPGTPGYDPFVTLAQFYFGKREISAEEMTKAKSVIDYCMENGLHPDKSTLLSRFNNAVMNARGSTSMIVSLIESDLAEGLLLCLNPYRAYEAYTRPNCIRHGIYDHFKGGVYMTRDFSSWASGKGETVVEYLSLLFATKHSRLGSQWCEVVKWPDGEYRSRFVLRGTDLNVPEPSFKVPSPTQSKQ